MLWKRRGVLVIGVVGVILTACAALLPVWGELGLWRYLVIGAAVVSVMALLLQAGVTDAAVVRFTDSDWKHDASLSPDGVSLLIPHRRHGRRSPHVSVYMPREDGAMEEVLVEVVTQANKDVVLGAVRPFGGEARIV